MKKQFGFLMVFLVLLGATSTAQKIRRLKSVVDNKSGQLYGLPLSVVNIPTGTFFMGDHNSDTTSLAYLQSKHPVLISSFYISATEVTNAQYKEFVNWVRDSIAATELGGEYLTIKDGDTAINWKYASKINYSDPAIMSKLTALLLDPSRSLSHRPQIDLDKLIYVMRGFDYAEAAKIENKGRNPKDFVYRYTVNVYPDTLAWIRDFGYSNNEQMATSYYASPKYKNYPVVGVNWKQANAFCDWFTKQRIYKEQLEKKMAVGGQCRLPTEAEWAYVASLNNQSTSETKNKKKKNKQEEKQATANPSIFPTRVIDGEKGSYSVYGMPDNVSEWTNTSYYEGSANFMNRFNPDVQWGTIDSQSKAQRRKVVRGGSWKDTPQFTTVANRFYADMDDAHSFIGFRVVINLPQ